MVFNWKYRALGWFRLPSIWFFQIILVAITPAVDLFLILSLPLVPGAIYCHLSLFFSPRM